MRAHLSSSTNSNNNNAFSAEPEKRKQRLPTHMNVVLSRSHISEDWSVCKASKTELEHASFSVYVMQRKLGSVNPRGPFKI